MAEDFRRVIYKHVLVINVVIGKQQPDGSGKGEAAIAAVRGVFLITPVRPHRCGQVVRVGKRIYREPLVANAYFPASKPDILQCGGLLLRQGEIFLHQSGLMPCPRNLVRGEPFQADQPGIAHDAFKLLHGFQEPEHPFLVPDFFREDMPPAEDGKVALLAHPLFRGPGNKQVGKMVQERAFVEMQLETAIQESRSFRPCLRLVPLLQEPVLAVDDGVAGQYLDRFPSCLVHGLVIGGSQGEDFRKADFEPDGHVRVLRKDAPVLHGKKGELTFQGGRFQYVSHIFFV